MAITYRDEKGSNLTAAEVDQNFRELESMINGIVLPPGVGLVSFSVVGNLLYANLTDASQVGPYILPTVSYTWRDEWTADTLYSVYDFFSVAGDGVYLVLREYQSPADDTSGPAVFDPDVSDTEGPLLQKMFGTPSTGPLVLGFMEGTEVDYTSEFYGQYVQVDSPDPFTLNILPEADTGIIAGQLTTFRQRGVGQITINPTVTSIVINSPESLKSRKQFSTLTLVYLGGDEYDLAGDLELI